MRLVCHFLRQHRGRLIVLLVALAGAWTCLSLGPEAEAQSRSSLRRRQAAIRSRTTEVERQLRRLKVAQKSTAAELYVAQDRLTDAEGRFKSAQRKLRQTQDGLRKVRKKHEETKQQLDKHTKTFGRRLRSLYEQGDPGYIEVVLGAQDFSDFVDRSRRCEQILNQDQETLQRIIVAKHQLERQQADLEQRMREEQRERTEYQERRDELRSRKQEVSRALGQIKQNRAEWEQTYAELLQASREVERALRSLYSASGRTSQRYSGHWSGSFLQPVSGPFTSYFGWRRDPFTGGSRFHTGLDISAPRGTPIRAAAAGLVIHSGWWGAYGKCVVIDHGSATATLYGHMLSTHVYAGQTVARGQVIGTVDSTGRSTGNHVHFEVRKNGTPVNPLGAGL